MSSETAAHEDLSRATWRDTAARRVVLKRLNGTLTGDIYLRDPLGSIGDQGSPLHVQVRHPRLYRRLLLGGSNAASDSYVDGDWDTNDLPGLCAAFLKYDDAFPGLERFTNPVTRLRHWVRRNSRSGSRKNIHAHYDLGNEFFRLFLDETMAYSSGVFEHADDTLQDASLHKFERLCRSLRLRPDDEVLEIGCGWGGFAVHAAAHYGCKVTAITISQEQFAEAATRVRDAGLQERVDVQLVDYRDVRGRFDKIVSIEMIEAVGHRYLGRFFRRCGELLKEDGLLSIQAITISDQAYERYRRGTDFIREYIFPGGCLPSVHAMLDATRCATNLALIRQEDLGQHYARTLQLWRERFLDKIDEVRALGFDERFIRMWLFYLASCEAGFRKRHIGLSHLTFAKPGFRMPLGGEPLS